MLLSEIFNVIRGLIHGRNGVVLLYLADFEWFLA